MQRIWNSRGIKIDASLAAEVISGSSRLYIIIYEDAFYNPVLSAWCLAREIVPAIRIYGIRITARLIPLSLSRVSFGYPLGLGALCRQICIELSSFECSIIVVERFWLFLLNEIFEFHKKKHVWKYLNLVFCFLMHLCKTISSIFIFYIYQFVLVLWWIFNCEKLIFALVRITNAKF